MTKNVLLLAGCVLMASCSSKQHKAESLVKDYLNTHLSNHNSYENARFGDIDTVFKRFAETKQGDSLIAANIAAKQKVDKIRDTIMSLITISKPDYMAALKRQLKYEADTSNFSKAIRSNELLFKGPIKGWQIIYSYSVKGNMHNTQFRLDSDLTKVIAMKEIR